ncbi:MAG: NTP transferase domain-containing protein [Candidatus Electrothrix scaldis]|nr:MAG: NTP transferase domain-containing protein [Candidatus Electrothrix sp. GW3-3]
MKTAILITARLKSTRLKEKALKSIMGRPMLSHMIERLRLAKRPEQIIICTSTVAQDDRLCELAEGEGVEYFRGDPDDVLHRMLDAANYFQVDTIVSCTADNPFVDPVYIDKLVDFHLSEENDFSMSEGLPFGTFSYALKRGAVEKACKIKDAVDTEVWGGYFTQTGLFKCGVLSVTDETVRWPELRLTVDTPEDFSLISKIFEHLYRSGKVFQLEQIVDLLKKSPALIDINKKIIQKNASPIKVKI